MGKRLMFLHHFLEAGGVERQLYYLANGLSGHHEVTLLLCEAKGPFLKLIDKEVAVIGLDAPFKGPYLSSWILKIVKRLKKEQPDILISFHGSFHWIAVLLGRLLHFRVVCVFPGYMAAGRLSKAHRFIFHLADGLVAVSQSVKNSMINNLLVVASEIQTIENAIDSTKIRELSGEPLDSLEKQYFESSPVIVSMGRLAKGKGFDVILDALSRVRKDCTLLIMGDGPEKAELRSQIIRLGLSDKVFLLGNQENPYKFLKRANFFVLASESEGLPTVILEAMCLGVPCICTRYLGGTKGVVSDRENGYLVNRNDPQDLAKAIEFFLSTEAKNALDNYAQKGMDLVNEEFELKGYIGKYLAYLEKF